MDSSVAEVDSSDIAADVVTIRSLLRRRNFGAGAAAAEALLQRAPEHRDVLLAAAAARRFAGNIPAAFAILERLEQRHPRFSRLHEERGHCFVVLKQAQPAIDAFLLAVNLNHALPASWSMLEGLYRMTGQTEKCTMAGDHVATLRNLPGEVVTATGLFMDGDLDLAEPMVRSFLLQHGDHVEAMRLLARIGTSRKVYDDAELLLRALLELAPDYRRARAEYAEVLIEVHKYSQAREQLDILMREEGDQADYYRGLYATTAVGLGEHERAVGLYRSLLKNNSNDADVHLSIGHALKTLGRRDAAIDSYRQAAACRPNFGDAYWSLANLKTYRFSNDELADLKSMVADPTVSDVDRCHLQFALAKAFEDRGEYAQAFACYELGNASKRSESNYRPEIIENNTRLQIGVCTREFLDSRSGCGAPDPAPIFIVGLPRSGSTLIEQILASHSQVEGTQELPNIQQIVAQLRGREAGLDQSRYPAILAELPPAMFERLGAQYLEATRVHRTGKPFFIDKMPNNFRHLGLIRLMLPNARIIDARRSPLACCFSNLKQLFAKGQEFTYGIEDIARYYRTYLDLMRHWDQAIPGGILRVHHEDVVADLYANVSRILDFCGLRFESGCVEFHKTVRSVRTASSEQVRQPIYRDGLDQWRHFEPWLGPLKAALGDALERAQ